MSLIHQHDGAAPSLSAVLAKQLSLLGVTQAYGVMGGAIAGFLRAVVQAGIEVIHCRHEAGAAFAAIEASLCTKRPVLVFTTAGPGLSNAMTGMLAARLDGAHLIFVSAATSPAHRGRAATQETSAQTMWGAGLMSSGAPLHYASAIDHPHQLAPAVAALASGLQQAQGFVAHLSLSIAVQGAALTRAIALPSLAPACVAIDAVREHAKRLASGSWVIWLGFGARHAAASIFELVERTGARVMCSPRAKGTFPEDHPAYLGVTGLGGHIQVEQELERDRPDHILVLGTRMGESTSFWSESFAPAQAFLHVDVDPSSLGIAYPHIPTLGVVARIEDYVPALLTCLAGDRAPVTSPARLVQRPTELASRDEQAVRPQFLVQEVERAFLGRAGAWLMAESGNSFCWATHLLRLRRAGSYRVSTSIGSMGHATCGVVGAALARKQQAIALVGDGAMLMLNEVHTAVTYGADAVWIVLNDACYLMCAQGMQMMGWQPFACELPRVDFVGLAQALGATGRRITTEAEVRSTLEEVATLRGPVVVDVSIDRREVPPSGRRNRSLMQQGAIEPELA